MRQHRRRPRSRSRGPKGLSGARRLDRDPLRRPTVARQRRTAMSYEYERVATPASGLRLHLNENTRRLLAARASTRSRGSRRAMPRSIPTTTRRIAAVCARLRRRPPNTLAAHERPRRRHPRRRDGGVARRSARRIRSRRSCVAPAFDMYAACTDALGGRDRRRAARQPDFEFPLGRDAVRPISDAHAHRLAHESAQSDRRNAFRSSDPARLRAAAPSRASSSSTRRTRTSAAPA